MLIVLSAWLFQENPQEMIDRLEKRVERLRDLECAYPLEVAGEDEDFDTLGYAPSLTLVRGRAFRVEARRPGRSVEEGALPPFVFRCDTRDDSILYEISTLEPSGRGSGIPIARMRFRADPRHPAFRRIDPFLSPAEFPARLYFDDPLLLAAVAPRQFLSLEPDLRLRRDDGGWVLESRRSFLELARSKELHRIRIVWVSRRYFVDKTGRVIRCEMRFRMKTQGEGTPLMTYSARRWQTVGGAEIPAEIEVGFGEADEEDRPRIDRRRVRRISVTRFNTGVDLPSDDDIAADAVLRKAVQYEGRLKRNPGDAVARYSRVLARHVGGQLHSGLGDGAGRGDLEPEEAYAELSEGLKSRPESRVLRSCALLLSPEAGDPSGAAARWGKEATPDERAWILARGRKIDVDFKKLSLDGQDLWTIAGNDPPPGRAFERKLDLMTLRARWSRPFPKDDALGRVHEGDATALEEVAKDPAAAGFVLSRARGWIERREISASLRRSIDAAGRGRVDDPLVPALLGCLAEGDSAPLFAAALERARGLPADSPRVPNAWWAVWAAAEHAGDDEARLTAAGETLLELLNRVGRPSEAAFGDPRRNPLLLLARKWSREGKQGRLYNLLRRYDWPDERYYAALHARLDPAFVEAARAECATRKDAREHAALARFVRERFRLSDQALEIAEAARALAPGDPEVLRVYAECARPEEAIAAYRVAGGIRSRVSMAEIEVGRGRQKEVREALQGLDYGWDGLAAERAAAVWRKIGALDEALASYQVAERLGRRNDLAMGKLSEKKGDVAEAMRRYNRSIAAGELDPSLRVTDPGHELPAEKAKSGLYERIGGNYFLKRFLAGSFSPLSREREERVRALMADPDEEAADELRAIGSDAAPVLGERAGDPRVRRVLLEWAEPR